MGETSATMAFSGSYRSSHLIIHHRHGMPQCSVAESEVASKQQRTVYQDNFELKNHLHVSPMRTLRVLRVAIPMMIAMTKTTSRSAAATFRRTPSLSFVPNLGLWRKERDSISCYSSSLSSSSSSMLPPRRSSFVSIHNSKITRIRTMRAATSSSLQQHHRQVPEHDSIVDYGGLLASRLGLDPLQNKFHGPIVYHERYSFRDWPPNHTFPMDKFERIAYALQTTEILPSPSKSREVPVSGPPQVKRRPIIQSPKDFFRPLDLEHIPYEEWFFSIMDEDYVSRFLEGMLSVEEARYIGFREQTSRPELIERTVLEVAGTVLTCQLALQYGIASNVAGGTHHAHPMGGAGYTILNDLAVASNFLLNAPPSNKSNHHCDEEKKKKLKKKIHNILVVDCDVHQGDGTAKFHIPGLSTLSLHCASNYPRLKANSTYDVGIEDGCRDDDYLKILETSVNKAINEVRPDLIIYDAGVDIYEHDRLGRLKITENGIRKRDHWVLDRCVSAGIPVAAVVGGGYDKDVDALARRHAIVHEECASVWRKYSMWNKKTDREMDR